MVYCIRICKDSVYSDPSRSVRPRITLNITLYYTQIWWWLSITDF